MRSEKLATLTGSYDESTPAFAMMMTVKPCDVGREGTARRHFERQCTVAQDLFNVSHY
jgi:hypothetical protein